MSAREDICMYVGLEPPATARIELEQERSGKWLAWWGDRPNCRARGKTQHEAVAGLLELWPQFSGREFMA